MPPHRAPRGSRREPPRSSSAGSGDEPTVREPERSLIDDLSAREIEVLRLIARGLENAEIAEALGISPRTAKNHVSRILAKLGQPGRVQAAVYAVRRGLS